MGILDRLRRTLAPQRTVSLYSDQELKIKEFNEKYNLDLKFADMVREGIDLLINQIEEELIKQVEIDNK
jgi:hypothetical protein